MIPLSHSQWQRVNQMALSIHAADGRDELVRLAVEEIPHIVGGGYACWNEHAPSVALETIETTPSHHEAILSRIDAINRLRADHPVVAGLSLIEDTGLHDGVFALTDFVPERNLEDVSICREVYRHVEANHQLVTQFVLEKGHGVLLTVNRDRPFLAEQRTMLEILRGHFHVACRRHLAHERLEKRLARASGSKQLAELSRREREVLPHVLAGKTNPEIGIILGISVRTVEKHVARILQLAGVENRRALMSLLIPPTSRLGGSTH